MNQRLIGEDVELLLLLALHIGQTRGAQNIAEPGAPHSRLDHLGGQRDAGKQPRERSARAGRMDLLLLHDVLLHSHDQLFIGQRF